MVFTISRTDLGRKTREVLERVRHGHTAVIESYGQRQAVLLDALDYRLLRALAQSAVSQEGDREEQRLRDLMERYLHEEVSLGRVAEELGVSRFELMERFERLGAPMHLGLATTDEARTDVETARRRGAASR